jgi:hypothetical protein
MILKAGKYFIGDPCYIFEDNWEQVLRDTNYFKNSNKYKIFGQECYVGDTKHGDGCYTDNKGRQYGVDTGLIGVLPATLLKVDNYVSLQKVIESDMMHIVDFEKDFEVAIHDGVFFFRDIIINTKDEEVDSE